MTTGGEPLCVPETFERRTGLVAGPFLALTDPSGVS